MNVWWKLHSGKTKSCRNKNIRSFFNAKNRTTTSLEGKIIMPCLITSLVPTNKTFRKSAQIENVLCIFVYSQKQQSSVLVYAHRIEGQVFSADAFYPHQEAPNLRANINNHNRPQSITPVHPPQASQTRSFIPYILLTHPHPLPYPSWNCQQKA